MAAEAEAEAEAEGSFLEQLLRATYGGGGGSRRSFFPIVLGVMGSASEDEDQDGSSASRRADRIVLVNPVTQGMVVLRGDAALVSEILSDRRGSTGPPPASKASIEALRAVEVGESEDECPVCLDGLGGGAVVVKEMPCRHRFHGGCIETWLRMHGSCPVCRHRMPVEEARGRTKGGGDGEVGEEEEEEEEGAGRRGREREVWLTIAFSRRTPAEQQQQEEEQDV